MLNRALDDEKIFDLIGQIKEEAKNMGISIDIDTYLSERDASGFSPRAYDKDLLLEVSSASMPNNSNPIAFPSSGSSGTIEKDLNDRGRDFDRREDYERARYHKKRGYHESEKHYQSSSASSEYYGHRNDKYQTSYSKKRRQESTGSCRDLSYKNIRKDDSDDENRRYEKRSRSSASFGHGTIGTSVQDSKLFKSTKFGESALRSEERFSSKEDRSSNKKF